MAVFPGAHLTKTRPAVVISTEDYHVSRPDVVLSMVTSRRPEPLAPSDCELRDWRYAGLHGPSYFRLYLVTIPQREVRVIGRLSEADWGKVLQCAHQGLACGS